MPRNHISDLAHLLWQQHTNHLTHHITKSMINALQSTFDGAIFHCADKHASSLRIFCPCLYFKAIETTFVDTSIFETVTGLISADILWAILSLGHWKGPHHFYCGLSISADAQHPGQNDLSTDPSGLPQPRCLGRCLYTP